MRRLRRGALAVAALLVVGAVATRVLVARAEAAYPPRGRTVAVDGLAQHVVERGDGAPIVFVHGAFGASQDFVATVFDDLARRHRCVAVDRPGHGYSERPDGVVDPGVQAELLLDVVAALELDRPLLVGFSYGGAVALTAALRAPDAVRGVVLLNAPSHPWPDPVDFQYVLPTVPLVGPLAVHTWLTPFAHVASKTSVEGVFAPEPVPASFDASPVPLALRPASYVANAADMRTLKPFLRGQADRYDELAVPTTIVVSDDDRVVSPTLHSQQLHDAAPDSTLIRVPDAGHQLLYTHTQLVIDVIAAALGDA